MCNLTELFPDAERLPAAPEWVDERGVAPRAPVAISSPSRILTESAYKNEYEQELYQQKKVTGQVRGKSRPVYQHLLNPTIHRRQTTSGDSPNSNV